MAEARNGATDLIDKIARLPGLEKTFDKVSAIKEDHVLTARRELHEMAHSHGPSHGTGFLASAPSLCGVVQTPCTIARAPVHLKGRFASEHVSECMREGERSSSCPNASRQHWWHHVACLTIRVHKTKHIHTQETARVTGTATAMITGRQRRALRCKSSRA